MGQLEELANEIESLICDWNRPSQLQDSVEATAMKIAKWHQREVKKGRVEELKKLWNKTQPDIMPLGTPPSDLNGQVILDRLEELEG